MNLLLSYLTQVFKTTVVVVILTAHASGGDGRISLADSGRLEYGRDAQGNRIPDFSHSGYRGAEVSLPRVRPSIIVHPSAADDTRRIQAAIDFVSQLSPNQEGARGAVLLGPGEFQVSGQIRIESSGVVLRGHGAGPAGTLIHATGSDRRSLIRVRDPDFVEAENIVEPGRLVINAELPVGSTEVQLNSTGGLTVGMQIKLTHPSSKAWIEQLGMERMGWREGSRDIHWNRMVTAVNGNRITLDAPLTLAINPKSQVTVRRARERQLTEVGIEDLALVTDYDRQNPRDEEHAWYGVQMQHVRDGWVSRVQFRHFAGGAVTLGDQTSRITVQDCAVFEPVSEAGGYRRHTFFTLGQQCLFLRCWSENGIHDFSAGHCVAGPNAFVNCYAKNALGDSGPIESVANGILFDNVRIDGHDLNLMNRWNAPRKTGWAALNCLIWQCQAANVRCDAPPVGENWVIGIWATPAGTGHFESSSEFVKPISLYQQQLKERVGETRAKEVGPFLLDPVGATNPTLQEAREFTAQSTETARQLIDLIQHNWQIKTPRTDAVVNLDDLDLPSAQVGQKEDLPWKIENGWLTVDGKVLAGEFYRPGWWRGDLLPKRANALGPAITRFAPGRSGTGLTDDLDYVATLFKRRNIVGYDHHYGLWYDRRRDDHLMVQRRGGNVVPPFYEQPFARTGQGQAWDGLSRYDLQKFNPWYWDRLRQFADLGLQHGFALFHHHYFQHNVLEAGAHWADSPWRPANNVNSTGFPEPPHYVGDKRIFFGKQFYDLSNPHRRSLHRRYIRKCLDNFFQQPNVLHLTSGEFTGPLSFVQFWIDTVVEWEEETGNDAVVALSCPKDVQDAILHDANRAPYVDLIDIRYWTYTKDGELYAPPGGTDLSPRQHRRRLKPAGTSFDSILRSVREYRQRFPDKAVTYHADIHCGAKRDGWAILIGGGSLANLPRLPDSLAQSICRMRPVDLKNTTSLSCLADEHGNYLIYSNQETPSRVDLPRSPKSLWRLLDMKTGKIRNRIKDGQIPAGRQLIWVETSP